VPRPKAHGDHGFQVVQIADLAGGVAAQGHGQFVAGNADAVVFDRDQAHPPGQQAQRDLRGAGIQGVVHQLAHHGGGALHHLAGGDLADEFVRKVLDAPASGRAIRGSHCR